MKTVPTLRVVSKPDAPAELDELGVDDLPAEVRLALTEIAGAAREGLLAMSVAAGLAVMQAHVGHGDHRGVWAEGRPRARAERGGSRRRPRLGGARRAPGAGEPGAGPHH